MNKFSQRQIAISILTVALIIGALILMIKDKKKQEVRHVKATTVDAPIISETVNTPMSGKLETVTVKPTDVSLKASSEGIVQANRELTVQAEVTGKIIDQSKDLDAGGILSEGQMMLKIDPRNYLVAIEQEKAKVEKAEFELMVEKGKQMIAEREWELFDPTMKATEIGQELALRKPHVREKEAALSAAKSALDKSNFELERTIIRAPFNALIIEEYIEKGQLVTPGTKIAKLVSTDEYRVQVSVPYDQLSWIRITPKDGLKDSLKGTPVIVTQQISGGKSVERKGYVLRLTSALDPSSNMAKLIIAIEDPLGLQNQDFHAIPLLIGTTVKIDIIGADLKNVFVVPEAAVHPNRTVWVLNNDKTLDIRSVEIAGDQGHNVVISNGLNDGDQVIISPIANPVQGMKL